MTNYARGAYLERQVAASLETDGYFTMRSAGSHGLIDIVAVKPGELLAIQVKADGRLDPGPWNELYDLASGLGMVPLLVCREGRKLRFYRLLGRKVPRSRVLPRELWTADQVEAA